MSMTHTSHIVVSVKRPHKCLLDLLQSSKTISWHQNCHQEIPLQITCRCTGNHQMATRNADHHFLRLTNVLSSDMACCWPQRAVNSELMKRKHLSPSAVYTCLPAKILRAANNLSMHRSVHNVIVCYGIYSTSSPLPPA